MPDHDQLTAVIDHITDTIGDDPDSWVEYPGGWPDEIELALLDAVFSANANYGRPASEDRPATGVFKVIGNWRKAREQETLDSLSALVSTSEALGVENLPDVLDNRQKVPGGSMRKGVAVYEAAKKLLEVRVEHAADLVDDDVRTAAAEAYASVPGLGWVTFDYFLNLLGHPTVKADRMVIGFVGEGLGVTPNPESARDLVLAAAERLGVSDPRFLDYAIWDYQRRQ